MAPVMSVDADVQATWSVCTMVYTRANSPPVTVMEPTTSNRRRGPSARDSTRNIRAKKKRTIPMGTLTKRIQRHERYWVRMPPNSAPAAPPPAATALHTPRALARARCSVKVTVRMVRVAGDSTAAPTPCSDRAAIRVPWFWEKPPTRLAPVKRTSPTSRMRRRPNRSASLPPSNRRPPKVSE